MRKVKFGNGKENRKRWFLKRVIHISCFNWISALQGFPASLQTKRGTNEILLQQLEKEIRLARQIFLQESFRRPCTPPQHQLSSGSPPWRPCPPPSSSSPPPTSSPPPSTSSSSRVFLSRRGFVSWIWKARTLVISETTTIGNMC